MKFVPIVQYDKSKIYAAVDSFISFSNSPYPAHRQGYGIDIYNGTRSYLSDALSPVDGKFIYSKWIGKDNVSAIQINEHLFARILHLDPAVDIGQYVYVGDYIGNYIRSPFFEFWTDPHIHVEFRNSLNNILRSSGGLPLTMLFGSQTYMRSSSVEFRIISKMPEYLLVSIPEPYVASFGQYYGLKVQMGNTYGLLEGGIPYYGYGRVYSYFADRSEISLFNMNIGKTTVQHNIGIFETNKQIKLMANDYSIRGIALDLYFSQPVIKIIPFDVDDINNYQLGELIRFTIKSS